MMYIKIEPINETEKAYQLTENCWIPKSILDGKGLKHPYYQIKNWWFKTLIEKVRKGDGAAEKQLILLKDFVMGHQELPGNIKQIWQKYWSTAYSSIGSVEHDYDDRRQEIGEWELGIYD